MLTTITQIGYGDYTPQNSIERIFIVIIELFGATVYAYLLGSFIDLLSNWNKHFGVTERDKELNDWIVNVAKLSAENPIKSQIYKEMLNHFQYYWKNDRLSTLRYDDYYMGKMPKKLRILLIKSLYEDIFCLFRGFFLTEKFKGSQFYYDIAFQIFPLNYKDGEFILGPGDVVHEVFLVTEGAVSIYFEYDGEIISKSFGKGYHFGSSNIFGNKRAEFTYKVLKKKSHGCGLSVVVIPKHKLLKVLKNYPEIWLGFVVNARRNGKILKDLMKDELKSRMKEKGKILTSKEVDEIFIKMSSEVNKVPKATKDCKQNEVIQPIQPWGETKKKKLSQEELHKAAEDLQAMEVGVSSFSDEIERFNKNITNELNILTVKLTQMRTYMIDRDRGKLLSTL